MRRFSATYTLLLLLLPIGFYGKSLDSSSRIVEAPESLLVAPKDAELVATSESPISLQFVLSPNGTIHAIDKSGKQFWSFSSGGTSLMVIEPIKEWSSEEFLHQEEFLEQLKTYISETPVITDEGVLLGTSLKTVFVVDPVTGTLIYKFNVDGTTLGEDAEAMTAMLHGIKPIFFQRTDHTLKCFEVRTGSVKWSVSFAEIASLAENHDYLETGKDSNGALMFNSGWTPSNRQFQGTKFTEFSMEPLKQRNRLQHLLENRPFTQLALQAPNNTLSLPVIDEVASSRGFSVGWLVAAMLAILTLAAMVFKGIFNCRRKNKVKTKARKRTKNGKGGEIAGKQGNDKKLKDNLGDIQVTDIVIGYGSHGTRIFEGFFQTRAVAVKCILSSFYDKAMKESAALMALDKHPNVVRYFAVKETPEFIYIALERCSFNLETFIIAHSTEDKREPINEFEKSELQLVLKENYVLWDEAGFPTPLLMKVLRDVVTGLFELHRQRYVHRDLKPQNVLIHRQHVGLIAKLSDMGISKRLTDGATSFEKATGGTGMGGSSGWQAPEQITKGKQTRAVDMFSLGCLIYFCVTAGRHPFGEQLERDSNIVRGKFDLFAVDHFPEATDIFSSLLDPEPKKRPTAVQLLMHPFFWTSRKRLEFLVAASERVEREDREVNSVVLAALEAVAPVALGGAWDSKLDDLFLNNLGRYRLYNFRAVRDLLRVIRNKYSHFRELPSEVKELFGGEYEGYEKYFRVRFPKLLMEVYNVLIQHCKEEETLREYFSEKTEFDRVCQASKAPGR